MVILTARQGVTRQQIMNILPAETKWSNCRLYWSGGSFPDRILRH
jgi:hypothetical protein